MEINYHLLFKILVVGNSKLRNSEVLHPLVENSFPSSTIGVNFEKKKLEIDGKKIKLQIWDITGQESSQAMTISYYHDTHGFLLLYDVTDEASFQHVIDWLGIIESNANEKGFRKLLLANQCNLEKTRQVSKERGEKLAREHDMRYVENVNLETAIKHLTEDILDKNYREPLTEGSELLSDFK
ncbi:ras-related protein Rab-13-like isoform X1 [Montipora foliosa]|uniref:ras-related protein Rab-13-like isoform X1 n=1 Tax=Montipora foliosa TaxID=591990 RepID=UPI0035F13A11